MDDTQLPLIDASETSAKFAAYHTRNPHIYERFKHNAFALERAGLTYISVAFMFELIRHGVTLASVRPFVVEMNIEQNVLGMSGDVLLTTGGPRYIQINNNMKPYYVRKFAEDYPATAELFEQRRAEADADG